MSKAFTRESDDSPDLPLRSPPRSRYLPPGTSNYLTPGGAEKLRTELDELLQVKRPALASRAEGERRGQLHTLDQRVAYLQESLGSAVVVQPPPPPWNQVRFGATVTVRESDGTQSRYRLVGIDETDIDRDWVSWCSPIARGLLNRAMGERVRLRVPAGEREIEIIGIAYE